MKPPFAGINQVRFMRSAAVSRPLSPVPRAPAVIELVLRRRLRRIGPSFKRNRRAPGSAPPGSAGDATGRSGS